MDFLFIMMLAVSSFITIIFVLCPLTAYLFSISPLNKKLRFITSNDTYSDYMVKGIPMTAAIFAIIGWIILLT